MSRWLLLFVLNSSCNLSELLRLYAVFVLLITVCAEPFNPNSVDDDDCEKVSAGMICLFLCFSLTNCSTELFSSFVSLTCETM